MHPLREKVLVAWSGGKDSAVALYETINMQGSEISALLTTVTEDYDRISMHGVRRVLLERQADALGLPLETVFVSKNFTNEAYESEMRKVLEKHRKAGVSSVVFGDVFLEDVKKYREDNLAKVGMKGVFPIWNRDTNTLANTFVGLGFEAVISCVDSHALDKSFVGRCFDAHFLSRLPPTVDPCGENGEFHSFVFDGPIFKEKIPYTPGKVVLRDKRFYYCDLLPA
jgi:uncharacterized protein (TIGR00290 family)